MNKQEYLKKFSEKLSLTAEEVKEEFDNFLQEEKDIHENLSSEQQDQRALQRLALYYKRQLRSPAVGFEGIIIGASDCIDILAKQRKEANELYKTDPMTAISQGLTDEEGTPLDTRETWKNGKHNNQFGKPLSEHNFLRNVFGIAVLNSKTNSDGKPRLFQMTLSGQKAQNETLPLFKPVKFMAIKKEETDNEFKLNASQFTNFTINEKLELPEYRSLIDNHVGLIKLTELESYHTTNKDDFNRIAVVEGDVSLMNLEPTSVGSRILVLDDVEASLEDLDSKSVTCWIPSRINLDFAEGSKVLVVGRTSQGKKRDSNGNPTDEPGDISLNVFGIYALPEYKISVPEEVEQITEDKLNIE